MPLCALCHSCLVGEPPWLNSSPSKGNYVHDLESLSKGSEQSCYFCHHFMGSLTEDHKKVMECPEFSGVSLSCASAWLSFELGEEFYDYDIDAIARRFRIFSKDSAWLPHTYAYLPRTLMTYQLAPALSSRPTFDPWI